MLKQSLNDERVCKQKCEQESEDKRKKHELLLSEIVWKLNQNERLFSEIKELKGDILEQRNLKRVDIS